MDLPSPAPTPGVQAEQPSRLPPSLPLRQWKENWVRQLSPAAWREGEGAALQFPPDQQGLDWGEGWEETCGYPPAPPLLHAAQPAPAQQIPD